jgi:hypothetical protein
VDGTGARLALRRHPVGSQLEVRAQDELALETARLKTAVCLGDLIEGNPLGDARSERMPVVLKPEVWPAWLGEEPATVPQLKSLLAPYPSDEMICWPVSTRVGNVKNNDPSLIEPIVLQRCGARRPVIR